MHMILLGYGILHTFDEKKVAMFYWENRNRYAFKIASVCANNLTHMNLDYY